MSRDLAVAERPRGGLAVSEIPGGRAQAVIAAIEELNAIRAFVGSEMKSGLDFGAIPGTSDKKVLLLPGAQKIAMMYNSCPDYHVTPTELGNGHVEYVVNTKLIDRCSGNTIGVGVGSCSTMESKYRWRKGERSCPECGKTAISKGSAKYGGGWFCSDRKGGCKAKFADGDPAIEGQQTGRVEHPDIADLRNTVLKMAMKRSLVSATIALACLSELFTQDLDDFHDLSPREAPEPPSDDARRRADLNREFEPQRRQKPQPQPQQPQSPHYAKWAKDTARVLGINEYKLNNHLFKWSREHPDEAICEPILELLEYTPNPSNSEKSSALAKAWKDRRRQFQDEAKRYYRALTGKAQPAPDNLPADAPEETEPRRQREPGED